jgi:hypothetical protein
VTPPRADWVIMAVAPDETRRVWRFAPGEVRIGRDESCAVRLEAPDISGVHLRLLLGQTSAVAHDPGSRHGTWRAGARLPPGIGVNLSAGDTLEIGAWRLAVTRDDAGGVTTDSRDFDLRAAAIRTLRGDASVAEATPPVPGEAPGAAGSSTRPQGDRLYTAALLIAALGAVLAAIALVRALVPG